MNKLDTFPLLWAMLIKTTIYNRWQKENGAITRLGLLVRRIETNRDNIPT